MAYDRPSAASAFPEWIVVYCGEDPNAHIGTYRVSQPDGVLARATVERTLRERRDGQRYTICAVTRVER